MSGMANGTQIRAGIVRALARCKLECLFVVPLTVVVYTNNVERVLKERALARKSVIGSDVNCKNILVSSTYVVLLLSRRSAVLSLFVR